MTLRHTDIPGDPNDPQQGSCVTFAAMFLGVSLLFAAFVVWFVLVRPSS